MIAQGLMAKKTAQSIKKAFEKTLDPMEMVVVLRKRIRTIGTVMNPSTQQAHTKREIILSAYQLADVMQVQQK
jgi:hypothetical protein